MVTYVARGTVAKENPTMRIYLFLAAFWLMVALFFLLYPLFSPDVLTWTIPDTKISGGWLLLVFVAWNLVRWRLTRRLARPEKHETAQPGGPSA